MKGSGAFIVCEFESHTPSSKELVELVNTPDKKFLSVYYLVCQFSDRTYPSIQKERQRFDSSTHYCLLGNVVAPQLHSYLEIGSIWSYSSVGQSYGFLIRKSQVRVLLGPQSHLQPYNFVDNQLTWIERKFSGS